MSSASDKDGIEWLARRLFAIERHSIAWDDWHESIQQEFRDKAKQAFKLVRAWDVKKHGKDRR